MNSIIIRLAYLLCFIFFTANLFSQKITTEVINREVRTLSEQEQVSYVIKNFYSIYSADFDNALKLTRQVAAIAHKNNWKEQEAYCLMDEGVVLYLKGDYKKSFPQYLNAYKIFDSLQNFKGLAKLNNEMAIFYNKQSEFKKAYEHINTAITYAEKINAIDDMGTSLDHKGYFLLRDGKLDEADATYQRVYKIRVDQKDSVGLGYALLNLSSIELAKGHITKAMEYIDQSTIIRQKIKDNQGVAINMINKGETYYGAKDYKKAIAYFEEGLDRAISIGYSDLVQYTYDQLALSYLKLNDYKTAYGYEQKSRKMKDSLFNLDRAKLISDLELKYETEKKEQQIALQQSHINLNYAIIASLVVAIGLVISILFLVRSRLKRERELSVREAFINATLSSQETERKRFAQDLHDGMGQLISSLRLSIGSLNTQTNIDERIETVSRSEKIMNDMHHEIRSIAFNLMPHTLIKYGLIPALKEMAARINDSGKINVMVSSFDMPDRLNELQEISIYRIVQEWVNNSMKYSNPSKIEIQLVAHEREISITVEDNGKGFDTAHLENSVGNGWKNIQSRIKLIKGSLNLDSHPDHNGTTLSLQIPLEEIPINLPDQSKRTTL